MSDQILADDHDRQSGAPHVLLRAGEDDAILADIDRTREDIARHIRHQRHAISLRNIVPLCSIYGIVVADIDIVRIRIQLQLLLFRDPAEVFRLRGSSDVDLAELLCLLSRLFCKISGHDIICLALLHQVERHRRELRAGASLKKQHLVIVRDLHQRTQTLFRIFNDRVIDT